MQRVLFACLLCLTACITQTPDEGAPAPQPAQPEPAPQPEAEPAPQPEAEPTPQPEAEPAPQPDAEPWHPAEVIERVETAAPLDILCMDAAEFMPADAMGPSLRYLWQVATRPAGSTARFAERHQDPGRPQDTALADDPRTPTACVFLDLAGRWEIDLRVRDADGPDEPLMLAHMRVDVRPDQTIHVQLVWDTPLDEDQADGDGSDVDLHLRHPLARGWAQAPLDCYYANASPDWGPPGPDGNPSLDIDDVNGAGPENINLDQVEDTAALGAAYQVGVNYYRADNHASGQTWGPSTATVRIFIDGELLFEQARVLEDTGDFWHVAAIEWVDGVGQVIPVDVIERPDAMDPDPELPGEMP